MYKNLILFILAAVISVFAGCASIPEQCPLASEPGRHSFTFERVITKKMRMAYLEFLPDGFPEAHEKWPLVLFLHARQERGENLDKMLIHGPPRLIYAECQKFPFILLVPQCPDDDVWYSDAQTELLTAFLDSFIEKNPVDKDRVYVTGISMGGGGTWTLAAKNPGKFAAIVPMSTFGAPERAEEFRNIPTWIFHGKKDFWVPVRHAEEMAQAMKDAGGDVKLTVYPDQGHTAWKVAYKDHALYEWMLSQKRNQNGKKRESASD